jgi:glycosyltransferase involved in cell wall biosynthesis
MRSLAEALGRLIETPADRLRAMGQRGRAHVAASFGPDRVLAETVALYDALLAEKGL